MKFEPFGRSLETFQEFPIRRRRFQIWCAVAKPHGKDADAWCLHQCVSYLCASVSLCEKTSSRVSSPCSIAIPLCASVSLCESTSLCVSFPCSIAPSPSVPLCLCVSKARRASALLCSNAPSPSVPLCEPYSFSYAAKRPSQSAERRPPAVRRVCRRMKLVSMWRQTRRRMRVRILGSFPASAR